jgi:hypothetical protein
MLRLCLIRSLPDKLNRGPRRLTNLSRELTSKCMVTRYSRICMGKKKINFSTVSAGQAVGNKGVHDDIWLVKLYGLLSGILRSGGAGARTTRKSFGPKVFLCSRYGVSRSCDETAHGTQNPG